MRVLIHPNLAVIDLHCIDLKLSEADEMLTLLSNKRLKIYLVVFIRPILACLFLDNSYFSLVRLAENAGQFPPNDFVGRV